MPPHLVQVAITSVVSFLVGGAVAWRMLGRGHRGYSRKLAQELTDSVHDRCSAYRTLENRIDFAIADFERRDAELRNEIAGMSTQPFDAPGGAPVEPIAAGAGEPVVAEGTAEGTMVESDALSWMDACDGPGGGVHEDAGRTAFVGLPVAEPGKTAFVGLPFAEEQSAEETGNVVDRITKGLEVMQREKTAELAIHRGRLDEQHGRLEQHHGRIEGIEGRLHVLEASLRGPQPSEAVRETRVAPALDWSQNLRAIHERLVRSERELAAWRAEHERWSRERLACIESARELAARISAQIDERELRNREAEAAATSVRARAEELARETAKLQAAIARREIGTPRPVAPTPVSAETAPDPAAEVPRRSASAEAPTVLTNPPAPARMEPIRPTALEGPLAPLPAAPSRAAAEIGVGFRRVDPVGSPPARPLPVLEDIASLVDAMPGPISASNDPAPGTSSQISQLMRNLEIAQGEAEKYRKKLHEQSTQFTAAYAMLDRIRPFVQAIESEYAAQANPRSE